MALLIIGDGESSYLSNVLYQRMGTIEGTVCSPYTLQLALKFQQ